jgi:NAD(P)H-hydrate epimerase
MEKHIKVGGLEIPAITTDTMREVDRLMVEKYGVRLLQMMENAGRNLAELARRLSGGSVAEKEVTIVAGRGNNGGGGLAAARHLYNWGALVTIMMKTKDFRGAPEIQHSILEWLPIEMEVGNPALEHLKSVRPDVIIDALIGYGLAGAPRGWAAGMIEAVNRLGVPVLSLDAPSGLDATTGHVHNPCIRADATMTLALPKTGLLSPEAREVVGELYLADIGVPHDLYQEMGIEASPIFLHDTIIKLEGET